MINRQGAGGEAGARLRGHPLPAVRARHLRPDSGAPSRCQPIYLSFYLYIAISFLLSALSL